MAHKINPGRKPRGQGTPRPNARGQRPQVWLTGPDPVRHKKYLIWTQQRNQAPWREEGWSIPFDVWCDLWAQHWDQRGRRRGDYCMTRLDWSLPWTVDNVQVITRSEHARAQGLARASGWCSVAQKRIRARMRVTP